MGLTLKEKIKLLVRKVEVDPPIVPDKVTIKNWGNSSVSYNNSIPSIVWIYWHTEVVDSPITRFCIEEIKRLNPGFTVRVLHERNLKEWLPDFPQIKKELPLANISDLIRFMLLEHYGGFYLDASVLLTESLDWLVSLQQKDKSEAVAYYTEVNTTKEQYPTIETWCLGAVPHSPFIQAWLSEYRNCILSDDPDHYYDGNMELTQEESVLGSKYYKSYFACQLVVRRSSAYRLSLVRADDDAFLYSLGIAKKWSDVSLAELLLVCKKSERTPKMIKIINTARKRLDDWIIRAYYKKDSLVGRIANKK